ncbi:MAG TPA: hypothetical protein VGM36_10580 [Rhizomicrobium sp.]|jgi:hypothetical protein
MTERSIHLPAESRGLAPLGHQGWNATPLLLPDESAYITGQILTIDGGLSGL